jgi:protein-arginine kinase activator protein McsA
MKTIIPVFLVFAAITLFIKTPNEEQPTSILDELKTKSVSELQFYLDEAIEQEKYEIACVIRDLINQKKQNGTKS